jgi:hypothetical protein
LLQIREKKDINLKFFQKFLEKYKQKTIEVIQNNNNLNPSLLAGIFAYKFKNW